MTPEESTTYKAVEEALAGREDLAPFKENKRMLFAVQLRLDVDDIIGLAAESLTGGGDDKSADLIHVDRDSGIIVIAQAYEAKSGKPAAKVDKAVSLYQAVNWVFSHDLDTMPERLTPKVAEVRAALADNAIREIWVWYLHNLPESTNVQREMKAIESGVSAAIYAGYPELKPDIRAMEVGRETLASWYESSRTPILVHELIKVPVDGSCLIAQGPSWIAYTVTVTAEWLNEIYWTYGEDLFSGNVRGFLGYQKSKSTINSGIRETLATEPGNFWIFNNGITALVDSVSYDAEANELSVQGLSIVNGAQTTGAVKDFPDDQAKSEARIVMRFIKCPETTVVQKIIRYSNRQNAIAPADFRSNDPVQRRLVSEFSKLKVAGYTGGRRGGAVNKPRRSLDEVDFESASRALAAYHGAPGIAHGEPRLIWEDDRWYRHLFSEDTKAEHVLFCWSLIKAVEEYKIRLVGLTGELPRGKREQREYFDHPGSIHLMVTAIAECIEDILGQHIASSFRPMFGGSRPVPARCVEAWLPIVELVAPLAHHHLKPVLKVSGPPRRIARELDNFRNQVESMVGNGDERWAAFAHKVKLGS